MYNKNIQIIRFGTPQHDELVALRNQILRIPLGLKFQTSDLEQEYQEIHFGFYDSKCVLVGGLQLRIINESTLKMRQVCVAEKYSNQGIGTKLVRASEQFAHENGYSKIELHARENAIPFYLKLKYKKQGKPFSEVGIRHFKMVKRIK